MYSVEGPIHANKRVKHMVLATTIFMFSLHIFSAFFYYNWRKWDLEEQMMQRVGVTLIIIYFFFINSTCDTHSLTRSEPIFEKKKKIVPWSASFLILDYK